MSNELISMLGLVAIFVIGTTMGINMGVLGIVGAFILGTALGVRRPDRLLVDLGSLCGPKSTTNGTSGG